MIRDWNRETDNGAVHALGNGRMLIYAIGPEILQIVGAPYSAGSFGTITIPAAHRCRSERLPQTAVWEHRLDNGTVMTDVVDSHLTGFVRKIEAPCAFTLLLKTEETYARVCGEGDGAQQLSFASPNGNTCHIYRTPLNVPYCVTAVGCASIEPIDAHTFAIRVCPGESRLMITNDPAVSRQLEQTPFADILRRTGDYWRSFLRRGRPVPAAVSELCENVAIMIKCQQGEDGGILAGYPFHMAYIRDQYGTVRGLLKMGFYPEAEAVMRYYLRIWQAHGCLHNAQSVGGPMVFHIHENDLVEITGYLAILPFDIFGYTGDRAFLEEMLPLVRWALDCQSSELKHGMLPFNGDETYIAGGFLPRAVMYEGSAEATMLFAEGIRRYQAFTGDRRYADCLQTITDTYRQNFCPDDRYITNRPDRLAADEYPAGRHGVCEDCNAALTELTRTAAGRYVCPACSRRQPPLPRWQPKIYELAATRLSPIYIGSSLVPEEMLDRLLEEMAARYRQTGEMPSGCPQGECVGYDYGMFLYALTRRRHSLAGRMCRLTLDVLDETGVWCEYYRDGIARSTRCRPWESAINMEAVLTYLEQNGEALPETLP